MLKNARKGCSSSSLEGLHLEMYVSVQIIVRSPYIGVL